MKFSFNGPDAIRTLLLSKFPTLHFFGPAENPNTELLGIDYGREFIPLKLSPNTIRHLFFDLTQLEQIPLNFDSIVAQLEQYQSHPLQSHAELTSLVSEINKNSVTLETRLELLISELNTNAKNFKSVERRLWQNKDYIFFSIKNKGAMLPKSELIDKLNRALKEKRPNFSTEGAGLGLYFVLMLSSFFSIELSADGSMFSFALAKNKRRPSQGPAPLLIIDNIPIQYINGGDMNTSLSIQAIEKDAVLFISLQGRLDEDADLKNISNPQSRPIVIDFDQLTFINSNGVKLWIEFISALRSDTTLIYQRCPKILVDQFNMVKGLYTNNTQIESFYAPYYDEKSDSEEMKLITPQDVIAGKAPHFGDHLEFDAIEEQYFFFLQRSHS